MSDIEALRKRGLSVKGLDAPKKEKEVTRKLVIYGLKENLNDIIALIKTPNGEKIYSAKKKKIEDSICWQLLNIAPIPGKNRVHFTWFRENKKEDPNNFKSAEMKYLFDAFQKAGLIENDGWNQDEGGRLDHFIDKKNPRVEIYFEKY